MHESNRMNYLDAMGIDSYLSRYQLPGAALTRRPVSAPGESVPVVSSEPVAVPAADAAEVGTGVERLPVIEKVERGPRVVVPVVPDRREVQITARFSLAAITAGDWLWVEELRGMPLAREQVQLVQAMANALQIEAGAGGERAGSVLPPPDIAQFDWPIHTNQQLDLGEEAARTAVAGFLARKIEQRALGLVLLGAACVSRVPLDALACLRVTVSHTSTEMLADPSLKKQVWTELKSILR